MLPSATVQLNSITICRVGQETIVHQLSRQIRELILSGTLAIGTRIPATRELANELNVSRTTIRESYEQLIAESYLSSTVGKGTFVINHPALRATPAERNIDALGPIQSKKDLFRSSPQLSKRGERFLELPHYYSSSESVPFNPALPDFSLFPISKWTRILKKTLINPESTAMNYGDASGYPPLREAIAENLRLTRGLNCDSDQIIVMASSVQAIRRIVTLVLNHGESVWFGEPGMIDRRISFAAAGVNAMTVPIDDEGVVIEPAYKFDKHVRLAYVFPSRHYPFGKIMSLPRRLELLNWAKSRNAWILEDDYGCEFNHSGQAPPPIQTMDNEQRVIYMGGFSMTLFPALRLSYIVVPHSLIKVAKRMAQAELSVSTIQQPALAEFIKEGHFMGHIRKMRKIYHSREQFLIQFLQEHIADITTISGTGGGLNFILNLPSNINDTLLSEKLGNSGIIAPPVSEYYLNQNLLQQPRLNGLVMGLACTSRVDLEKCATTLVKQIKGY